MHQVDLIEKPTRGKGGGDGYTNLLLSTLNQAVRDGKRRRSRPNLMCTEFEHDFGGRINHSSVEVAEWVLDFIAKYRVKEYCLSVRDQDSARELRKERLKEVENGSS